MADQIGVEHEYQVWRDGARVDFRRLIHRRAVPGRRLDPGDIHAYRLHSGLKLTCDGAEAEIATPPLEVLRGVVETVVAWTGLGAGTLAGLYPECSFVGESTHLSVSVSDDACEEVGGLFARAFGPALMLLMDDVDSPGLLVRPRAGRVELGAEYVREHDLEAATALALGGVLLCRDIVSGERLLADLPRAARMQIEPAVDRWGWYLDRGAFGIDLLEGGRRAKLRGERRGRLRAQDLLERAWAAARERLDGVVGAPDLAAADEIVAGARPLPCERGVDRAPAPAARPNGVVAEGAVVATRVRADLRIRPYALTWDASVLEIADRNDRIFAAVPRSGLARFVADLDAGRLDRLIAARLRTPGSRVLRDHADAARGGWFDTIGPVEHLAPPERDVCGVPQRQPADPALDWPRAEVGPERVLAVGDTLGEMVAIDAAPPRVSGGADHASPAPVVAETPRFGKNIGPPEPPLISSGNGLPRWVPAAVIGVGIGLGGAVLVGTGVIGGDDGVSSDPPAVIDDVGDLPGDDVVPGADDGGGPGEPIDGIPGEPPDDPLGNDGPTMTPSPVDGGISPDLLGQFTLIGDGVLEFAYEGDRIIGRVVTPSRNTGIDLWGQLSLCTGDPQGGANSRTAESFVGDIVYDLDAFGSGRWFFFERVPDFGFTRCERLDEGEEVDVIFTGRQVDALGNRPDGSRIGFSHTEPEVEAAPSPIAASSQEPSDASDVRNEFQENACTATDRDVATPDVDAIRMVNIEEVYFRPDLDSVVDGFAPGGIMDIEFDDPTAAALPGGWDLEFGLTVLFGEFIETDDGAFLGGAEWQWSFPTIRRDGAPVTALPFGTGERPPEGTATARWVDGAIEIEFPALSTFAGADSFTVTLATTVRAADETATTCLDQALVDAVR
ncbi:MAG: hypothetical protein R8F63_13795 [Acidimicrobiales bacterium]|nr:hypothetical protein [Acidimicrobiales bacterium]